LKKLIYLIHYVNLVAKKVRSRLNLKISIDTVLIVIESSGIIRKLIWCKAKKIKDYVIFVVD